MAPKDVYKMVFTVQPPPGVKYIRDSGRVDWKMAWVWMRFFADERTMRMLTENSDRISESDEKAELARRLSFNSTYDASDKKSVVWSDIYKVSKPVAYNFFSRTKDQRSIWYGLMVLDHRSHEVFITACGDS